MPDKIESEQGRLVGTPRYILSIVTTLKMTTIIENLLALRAQMDATIAAVQADGSGSKLMPKAGKAKAPKAEKAPRANAGLPTLHGDWTKHVLAAHSTKTPEYLEWLAARIASAKAGELLYNEGHAKVKKGKKQVGDAMDEKEAADGAHTPWVGHWRNEHPEEFLEFKTAWEAANPKESRVASAKASQASSSDAEGESVEGAEKPAPKKRGAKKMADMTPAEKAAAQAKRAANKALKAAKLAAAEEEEAEDFSPQVVSKAPAAAVGGGSAPAPAAEVEVEVVDNLIPYIHKKGTFLRFGHLDEDGDEVWDEGNDLWQQNADGSKGAYAGVLLSTGKIDPNAEEPEVD
jgi:hypothetical protein